MTPARGTFSALLFVGSGAPPAATLTRARPLAPGRRAGAGVDCNECLCSIATVAISQVLEAGFLTEEELVSDPEEAVANILACSIQLLPELEAAGITILALLVRDSAWARGLCGVASDAMRGRDAHSSPPCAPRVPHRQPLISCEEIFERAIPCASEKLGLSLAPVPEPEMD